MSRPPITATIIAFNEEGNISRAIKSLSWADEVLVVDSGSTDQTVEKAKSLGAKVIVHEWMGYGKQKNFAQDNASHDWIINIDADEEVPTELANEVLHTIEGAESSNAFSFPRKTFYLGRWIRHGGWYPNRVTRVYHRRHSRWSEPNVHEQLQAGGDIVPLKSALHHYTFSDIQDQILTNLRYARCGALDLEQRGERPRLSKLVIKPLGKFVETYFIKRGFLDGLAGLIISINAAHSMFLKFAYLFEKKIRQETP